METRSPIIGVTLSFDADVHVRDGRKSHLLINRDNRINFADEQGRLVIVQGGDAR